MSLNDTASAERVHIAFFGRRNAGKSSLVNAVTNQNLSVVSDQRGTTTDPVKKAMELLPLGPVVIIDTPGFDDEGALGALRVEKTREVLRKTDVAVLVADATVGLDDVENALIKEFRDRKLPFFIALNKCDLLVERTDLPGDTRYTSAKTGEGIEALKEALARVIQTDAKKKTLVTDLIEPGDVVVLVIPIDESAPKGRLILPQQQVLRELLDFGCSAICCQPEQLKATLDGLKIPPSLVVTDSQAFSLVAAIVPEEVRLTSFSILFARFKGDLETLVRGALAIDALEDGDLVLIAEGCTHHRQCGDIGTVKLPAWIERFTKKHPRYEFSSGAGFPNDLSRYRLIIHCGGCMLNEKEMQYRLDFAKQQGIPIVNYGIAIARMNSILPRAIAPFDNLRALMEKHEEAF